MLSHIFHRNLKSQLEVMIVFVGGGMFGFIAAVGKSVGHADKRLGSTKERILGIKRHQAALKQYVTPCL